MIVIAAGHCPGTYPIHPRITRGNGTPAAGSLEGWKGVVNFDFI